MAAIGDGWAEDAWIEASWISGAWAKGVAAVGTRRMRQIKSLIRSRRRRR